MAREPTDREWRHMAGVHTECTPTSRRRGDDTPDACAVAGTIERFHSHDFAGPCPCDDVAPNAGSAT